VKLKYSRIYTGRVKIPPPKDRNCLIKDTALLKLHSAHDWIAAKSAPISPRRPPACSGSSGFSTTIAGQRVGMAPRRVVTMGGQVVVCDDTVTTAYYCFKIDLAHACGRRRDAADKAGCGITISGQRAMHKFEWLLKDERWKGAAKQHVPADLPLRTRCAIKQFFGRLLRSLLCLQFARSSQV
jgi:hypothetical protein